jgi:hypothetical protein
LTLAKAIQIASDLMPTTTDGLMWFCSSTTQYAQNWNHPFMETATIEYSISSTTENTSRHI